MLGVATAARAQDTPTAEAVGVAISMEDASGHALDRFYTALRTIRPSATPVRILFFGDSHTAGETFPREVRRTLQARFGDAGLGFFFPVRPWRYYRVSGIDSTQSAGWQPMRVTYRDRESVALGLGGMAAATLDSAESARVVFENPRGATHLEVWSYADLNGGALDLSIDGESPVRVRGVAETPTLVVTPFDRPNGIENLSIQSTAVGATRVFGAVIENGQGGVVLDSLGINGARIANQLSWNDAVFLESIRRRAPALVVFQYGTNESGDDQPIARYEDGVRRAVRRVQEVAPQASCVLVGPTDQPMRQRRTWVDRPRTREVNEVQRRVARDLGCAFFDTLAFQGGPLSTARWAAMEPPFASRDRIHLSSLGYQRLGAVFTAALLERFAP